MTSSPPAGFDGPDDSTELADRPDRADAGETPGARGRRADHPGQIPLLGWKDIALRVKDQFGRDHVTLSAAGVAFFGFTALVPLFAAALSIYGLVADAADIERLIERLEGAAPAEVVDVLGQQLGAVTDGSSGALGLAALGGIALALWSASSGVGHLIEAVTIAYDEDPDERPFWRRRLLAVGFTLAAVAGVAISAGLVTMASVVAPGGPVGLVVRVAAWAGVALLVGLGLAGLYRYGPDRADPRWSWVTLGSLFAIVAWLAVSVGFRFYVSRFGSYNETYGSLGAIVVTLLWLYLSSLIVIVGAEINAEVEHQTARDSTTGRTAPMGRRGAVKADTLGAAVDR